MCDNKGKTITKYEHNQIFGAYCDKPWSSKDWIKGDGKFFPILLQLKKITKILVKIIGNFRFSNCFALNSGFYSIIFK